MVLFVWRLFCSLCGAAAGRDATAHHGGAVGCQAAALRHGQLCQGAPAGVGGWGAGCCGVVLWTARSGQLRQPQQVHGTEERLPQQPTRQSPNATPYPLQAMAAASAAPGMPLTVPPLPPELPPGLLAEELRMASRCAQALDPGVGVPCNGVASGRQKGAKQTGRNHILPTVMQHRPRAPAFCRCPSRAGCGSTACAACRSCGTTPTPRRCAASSSTPSSEPQHGQA